MNKVSSPFKLFKNWFTQAQDSEPSYPDAFTLTTVSTKGIPSARTVLLKKFDTNGFVFFTNYGSKKGIEILENSNSEFLFYWKSLKKQIRISGKLKKIPTEESDIYWLSRGRKSQINSYLSRQSSPFTWSKEELQKLQNDFEKAYPQEIPRPEYWGGYCLTPNYFEFWSDGDHRWHHRQTFKLDHSQNWTHGEIFP